MIRAEARNWILSNGSKIVAAPTGRQRRNEFVERTRIILLETSCYYIKEQKLPETTSTIKSPTLHRC